MVAGGPARGTAASLHLCYACCVQTLAGLGAITVLWFITETPYGQGLK